MRVTSQAIVAVRAAELEELRRHHRADGVLADVVHSGAAETVTVKAGKRITTAGMQRLTEHVAGHGRHDGANRRVRLRSAAMGAAGTPNEVVSSNGSNARHTKVCDGMHAWLWRSNVR